jgi:uncharacterized membrane protein YhaH (DUF805 family)
MTPAQSIKTCLRKYASTSGRASRSEFWWFALSVAALFFILIAFPFVLSLLLSAGEEGHNSIASTLINASYNTAGMVFYITLLPLFAASVRRLHDQGKSGFVAIRVVGLLFLAFIVIAFSTMMYDSCDAHPENCGPQLYFWAGFMPSALFLGIIIAFLFSLRRPSQPNSNPFGPNPHEVTP